MTTPFPVPLDNLITFVKSLHPDGGPLDDLAEAVVVADRLTDQSDALIGHFVDQARRSGASWSEIGSSMGVSKQAAQKRFVFRWSEEGFEERRFSRFTLRARNAVSAAQASARAAGAATIGVPHLVAGLLLDPQGLSAVAIHNAGATDQQVEEALGVRIVKDSSEEVASATSRIPFDEDAKSALESTLQAALHLGHNYIGTEHILLGVLASDPATAARLAHLGVTRERVQQELDAVFARLNADREAGSS
jgi:hypothetical protein